MVTFGQHVSTGGHSGYFDDSTVQVGDGHVAPTAHTDTVAVSVVPTVPQLRVREPVCATMFRIVCVTTCVCVTAVRRVCVV